MRNKLIFAVCVLGFIFSFEICHLSIPAGAMGAPIPRSEQIEILRIDDFEDGDIAKSPSWWVFDNISCEIIGSGGLNGGDLGVERSVGERALLIKSKGNIEWYAGGLGFIEKYPIDLSKYKDLQFDIFGFGAGDGTLKIEIYDDDNDSWTFEKDKKDQNKLLFDDRFISAIPINWSGWKRVSVPFDSFIDDNPGAGNDKFDLGAKNGKGGVLQIQLICLASTKGSPIKFAVDNLRLAR
ncbi:hypothetical protein HZC34_04730 [Candidatus Saganbacteria bacterium]|nr:hypothetical protein [Candidatus Saganbacteria bacterium]